MTIQSKTNLAYLTTYEKIRDDIRTNDFSVGTKLVPLKEMAKQYKVSYLTVQRAVKMLQDEGWVHARRGGGIFVAEKPHPASSSVVSHQTPHSSPTHHKKKLVPKIAIVMPSWISRHGQSSVYSIINGFMESSDQYKWNTELVFCQNDDALRPEFITKFTDKCFHGVLWISPPMNCTMNIMRLIDHGIDVVATGRNFPNLPIIAIQEDLDDMAEKIVHYCVDNNFRNPLFLASSIQSPAPDANAVVLLHSFKKYSHSTGLQLNEKNILEIACIPQHILVNLLQSYPDVDAIICLNETIFPSIEQLDRENLWPHPESMVIFDLPGEYSINPDFVGRIPVAKISRPLKDIGRAAAQTLHQKWTDSTDNPLPLEITLIPPANGST